MLQRIGPVVLALGLVSLLNDVASEMIVPLLPAFMATLPGGGALVIGVMEGIAESVSAFLKLVSGWFSDRTGRGGTLMLAGYACAAVARPMMGLASHALHVVGLRIADRTGKGLRTSPRDALIASSACEDARGLAFSFHRAMDHTGALIGPLVAILLMSALGLGARSVILLAIVPGCMSLPLLVYALARAQKRAPGIAAETPRPPDRGGFGGSSRNFHLYVSVCFIFTLGNSSDLFLLLRASESGVDQRLLPALWALLHLSKILLSVPAGMISDRIGRKKPIILGWFVYSATYLLFPYAAGAAQMFFLFAFYGLYFSLTEGVEKAFVGDLVPGEKKGTAYGKYNFAVAAGALPASLLMGGLYQWAGAHAAFGTGAALALAASIMFLFVREPATRKT